MLYFDRFGTSFNPSDSSRVKFFLNYDIRFYQYDFSILKIIWADQQKTIERHKRGYVPLSSFDSEKPLIREKRLEVDQYHLNSIKEDDKDWQEFWQENPQDSRLMFNDELWDQEWYLVIKLIQNILKNCVKIGWKRKKNNSKKKGRNT